MDAPAKTILVTGSHRSGTTWVGKVLATAPQTAYVHEPFNVIHPCELTSLRMQYWYQRLNGGPDHPDWQEFHDLLSFRWNSPKLAWSDLLHPRTALRKLRTKRRRTRLCDRCRQIVLKDPIALLSTEWLAENFGVQPVIMIRHPAAFASSLQLKGWTFDFQNLLEQPEAIEEFFPEEREAIEQQSEQGHEDLIGEGAFLWRLLHKVILEFRRRHPEWIYLHHEDVSRRPAEEFPRLFDRVGLPFTSRTEAFLRQTSTSQEPRNAGVSTSIHNVVRNSAANINVWQQRLTGEEIERIRRITGSTADAFYRNEDWQIAHGSSPFQSRVSRVREAHLCDNN